MAREEERRRSRSRGRTPSELLARRQQLLAANGRSSLDENGGGGGGGGPGRENDESLLSSMNHHHHHHLNDQSAEAKLESLSVLLRNRQVSNEMTGASNNGSSLQDDEGEVAASKTVAAARGHLSPPLASDHHGSHHQPKSSDDVYILLAKKEKDLQLAAELGKVLLERNEDLSRANEQMAEEYSHKLELLEQEKHKLKRKLDQLDGEYENRLIELQTDCNILKNKLEQQQQVGRQAEKEKSKLIDDLVQQNQRLTSELAEATKSEELLASQLEQVNERLGSRLSNRSNHVAQVDALQEEIQILNQRKQDLERRLKLAQAEKANLNSTIDELGDKVLLFENLLNEKDLKIGELAIEINELRDSSFWLSARLESMISLNERLVDCTGPGRPSSSDVKDGEQHSHNLDDLKTISERDRCQLVEQLKELRLKRSSRIRANEVILLGADERRRKSAAFSKRRLGATGGRGGGRGRAKNGSSDDEEEEEEDSNDDGLLMSDDNELNGSGDKDGATSAKRATGDNVSDLISEIYIILNGFLLTLQQRKESLQLASSSSVVTTNGHHHHHHTSGAGSVTGVNGNSGGNHLSGPNEDSGIGSAADEMGAHHGRSMMNRSGTTNDKSIGSTSSSSSSSESHSESLRNPNRWRKLINEVRQLVEELPCSSCQLMISERQDFEQLQKLHTKVCEEIRLKNDELLKLSAANIEQACQLSVMEDKCKVLTDDLENCDKPTEEIVRSAWKTRDDAVARKNNAEIQLAKTRIENMQISSQLMEVVQQKGELSQKLAQFEDDIHYMMQRAVRQRFSWEEYAEETRRLGAKSKHLNGGATIQLTNLVPSIASSNAQGSSSFQQLLSLTGVNLLSPTKTRNGPPKTDAAMDASISSSQDGAASAKASLQQQLRQATATTTTTSGSNILTSLKSGTNRLNLRFWQRSAPSDAAAAAVSTIQPDKNRPHSANNVGIAEMAGS